LNRGHPSPFDSATFSTSGRSLLAGRRWRRPLTWALLAAVCLGALISCGRQESDTRTATSQTPEQGLPNADPASRKLELELRKLEQETSTAAIARSWVPAASGAAALIAVGFGAFQYFRDRHRDREVRIQDQFATGLGQVANFVLEDRRTSAGLLAALKSLRQVVALPDAPSRSTDRVSEVIGKESLNDIDFCDPEQVRFDPTCLDEWPDYTRWLRDHPNEQSFILYRYQEAGRELARRYPDFFSRIRLSRNGEIVVPAQLPDKDFLHFQQLLRGYRLHVENQPPDARMRSIELFGEAIGNSAFADATFRRGDLESLSSPT
jgi:hypothetical protein